MRDFYFLALKLAVAGMLPKLFVERRETSVYQIFQSSTPNQHRYSYLSSSGIDRTVLEGRCFRIRRVEVWEGTLLSKAGGRRKRGYLRSLVFSLVRAVDGSNAETKLLEERMNGNEERPRSAQH